MQGYILFTSPALFIMSSEFWYMLADSKKQLSSKWIFNLILILLIALPVRYSIERIKPFEKTDRNPQWVSDLKKLNEKKYLKGVLFNYPKPIEAMFYTNLTVYPDLPDNVLVDKLQQAGYYILLNDNPNAPKDISTLKCSEHLHLSVPN